MPILLDYQDTTPRHQLPYLFAAQAQKEVIFNEALGRIDALLHIAVAGVRPDIPAAPVEGECWIVGEGAQGAWSDHVDAIACYCAGDWTYLAPFEGMIAWNAAQAARMTFRSQWTVPATIALPSGGATVDEEARQAIADLVNSLTEAGILPPPPPDP